MPYPRNLTAEDWVLEAIAARSPPVQLYEGYEEKKYRDEQVSIHYPYPIISTTTLNSSSSTPFSPEDPDLAAAINLSLQKSSNDTLPPVANLELYTNMSQQEREDLEIALALQHEQEEEKKCNQTTTTPLIQQHRSSDHTLRSATTSQPSISTTPQPTPLRNSNNKSSGLAPRPVTQLQQTKPFKFSAKITLPVAIVLSLILALSLCLSPLGAPLWLIPVIIISGIYLGVIFTLIANFILRCLNPNSPSPTQPQYDGAEMRNYNFDDDENLSASLNSQYRDDALSFSQDEFWQPKDSDQRLPYNPTLFAGGNLDPDNRLEY